MVYLWTLVLPARIGFERTHVTFLRPRLDWPADLEQLTGIDRRVRRDQLSCDCECKER